MFYISFLEQLDLKMSTSSISVFLFKKWSKLRRCSRTLECVSAGQTWGVFVFRHSAQTNTVSWQTDTILPPPPGQIRETKLCHQLLSPQHHLIVFYLWQHLCVTWELLDERAIKQTDRGQREGEDVCWRM